MCWFLCDGADSGFDARTYASSVRDIDAPHSKAAEQCPKLVREVDAYYRKHETKYLAEPDYIGTMQTDINEKMRTILIDWLVEVGEEYDLDSQTYHKAVRSHESTRALVSLAGWTDLMALCVINNR